VFKESVPLRGKYSFEASTVSLTLGSKRGSKQFWQHESSVFLGHFTALRIEDLSFTEIANTAICLAVSNVLFEESLRLYVEDDNAAVVLLKELPFTCSGNFEQFFIHYNSLHLRDGVNLSVGTAALLFLWFIT